MLADALSFIIESEKQKAVLRRSNPVGLSRHENSAEHSWTVALAASVLIPEVAPHLDPLRVIKMLLIHDLETSQREKSKPAPLQPFCHHLHNLRTTYLPSPPSYSRCTSVCRSRIDQISTANSFKTPLGLRAPSDRFLLKCFRFNWKASFTNCFDPITTPSVKYRTRHLTS